MDQQVRYDRTGENNPRAIKRRRKDDFGLVGAGIVANQGRILQALQHHPVLVAHKTGGTAAYHFLSLREWSTMPKKIFGNIKNISRNDWHQEYKTLPPKIQNNEAYVVGGTRSLDTGFVLLSGQPTKPITCELRRRRSQLIGGGVQIRNDFLIAIDTGKIVLTPTFAVATNPQAVEYLRKFTEENQSLLRTEEGSIERSRIEGDLEEIIRSKEMQDRAVNQAVSNDHLVTIWGGNGMTKRLYGIVAGNEKLCCALVKRTPPDEFTTYCPT